MTVDSTPVSDAAIWEIYRAMGKYARPIFIGELRAENMPDAVLRAQEKWPEHIRLGLPHHGFSARRKK